MKKEIDRCPVCKHVMYILRRFDNGHTKYEGEAPHIEHDDIGAFVRCPDCGTKLSIISRKEGGLPGFQILGPRTEP